MEGGGGSATKGCSTQIYHLDPTASRCSCVQNLLLAVHESECPQVLLEPERKILPENRCRLKVTQAVIYATGLALSRENGRPSEMARGSSYLVAALRLLRFDPGTGSLTHSVRGTELTADFRDDGRLADSAGCNRYTTTYEARGSSLTVNPQIAATRMWCGDPKGAMAQEDAFLQARGRVTAYGIDRTVSSSRMPKRLPSSSSAKLRNGPRIEPRNAERLI